MNDRILSRETDSGLMLYDTEQDAVHVLNSTARRVYELLCEGKAFSEVETALQREFHVGKADLQADVNRCAGELRDKGLIDPGELRP